MLPILKGSNCSLMPYIITAINDDPVAARNEARGQIAFYYTTRLYHSILAGSGWEDVADQVATAFKAGDFAKMMTLVPDEMVDAIALTGSADEVKDKIQQWAHLSDHVALYSPSIGISRQRMIENMTSIINTFGEARK